MTALGDAAGGGVTREVRVGEAVYAMRVLVYEHLTATGTGRDPASPEHGMFREGRAMRDAVATDFGRISGVEVVSFSDEAGPVGPDQLAEAATACDWSLVIAPEIGDELARLSRLVANAGGRLLGPTPEGIRLTSDKLALAEHWRACGIPTPATTDREPTQCEAFPVVWKPRNGAGSTATFRLDTGLDVARAKAHLAAENHVGPMLLQEFVPGQAASVAFLCGPAGHFPLLPALQTLSEDRRFEYLGGEIPIPAGLAARAVALCRSAVECVPGLLGFVGVDLVLGEAADGSRDFAIEINPRLTTSYVGLRVVADFNIAEALLRMARGATLEPPRWKPGRVRFRPDGTTRTG